MNMRRYFVVILCAALSTSLLLMLIPSGNSPGMGEYNPWADINDDGTVNILDAIILSNAYNASGHYTPLQKASIQYDSRWVNITDKQGQDINITHDLNITDWNNEKVMVDITGKTTLDGELHRYLGLYQQQGWNKTYGGTGNDWAWDLVQTTDDGYALTGYTNSYGAGSHDFWLVKTDASGTMQWNKTYGGTGNDDAYALVETADGYALAGCTGSYGAGGGDFWLVKTDLNGNAIWNKTYGGTDVDLPLALVQTADGGYALAGYTRSYGAGSYDVWLVKTDPSGTMQWNNTYGGTSNDWAWALVQTTDHGYALGGYTGSYGAGGGDFWLVKTDLNGDASWNKTYGGTGYDEACALMETADGYALAGYTKSFGAGNDDSWLVKTDSTGNVQWNKTYGGTGNDEAFALVQTADGYALAGCTGSYGAVGGDSWLVKTDLNGNAIWNKTYGGTGYEDARALVQTADGGYALAGRTSSYGAGNDDFWLVKTDAHGYALGGEYGLVWIDSATNTITLHRGAEDPYWNYVRVRILKAKQ